MIWFDLIWTNLVCGGHTIWYRDVSTDTPTAFAVKWCLQTGVDDKTMQKWNISLTLTNLKPKDTDLQVLTFYFFVFQGHNKTSPKCGPQFFFGNANRHFRRSNKITVRAFPPKVLPVCGLDQTFQYEWEIQQNIHLGSCLVIYSGRVINGRAYCKYI